MIIYTAENKKYGFIYVGYTTRTLEERKYDHYDKVKYAKENNNFHNHLKKYQDGWEWKIRSPYPTNDFKHLEEEEKYWIKYYRNNYRGEVLNSTDGGGGVKLFGEKNGWFGKGYLKSGKNHWNWGNHWSEEIKRKNSESQRGEKHHYWGKKRPEHSEKMKGEKSPFAKNVILISPNNEEYRMKSYLQFCKDNGLNVACICMVLRGKRQQHKGWRGRYLMEEINNVRFLLG